MRDLQGVGCVPAWDGARSHHRVGEYARSPHEWLPRPFGGRVMVSRRDVTGDGIYLQVVPGPEGRYQIVRVELGTPVARGFKSQEKALAWIGRAIRAGVLPKGVVVVEPPDAE